MGKLDIEINFGQETVWLMSSMRRAASVKTSDLEQFSKNSARPGVFRKVDMLSTFLTTSLERNMIEVSSGIASSLSMKLKHS